jgi:hypothetical protein
MLAAISILVCSRFPGAAFADQLLTSDQAAQRASWVRLLKQPLQLPWGAMTMLSVDQFLRLISLPAVIVAFLIASQISGAGISYSSPQQQMAGE